MDWVKKHYDIAILAMATFVLLVNAGWISWSAFNPREDLPVISEKPPEKKFQHPDISFIQKAIADATKPLKWQHDTTGAKESLFVSRKYLLKDGKLLDPLEGGEMLHPPIPNT